MVGGEKHLAEFSYRHSTWEVLASVWWVLLALGGLRIHTHGYICGTCTLQLYSYPWMHAQSPRPWLHGSGIDADNLASLEVLVVLSVSITRKSSRVRGVENRDLGTSELRSLEQNDLEFSFL